MFIKTRIPKNTNCIRFHGNNAFEAYRLASPFLGGKGRIANAHDVMEARIRYGFEHPIWSCYITSSSTEWFGLNHEGQPFIVVLHAPSPLMDEKILRNYVIKRETNHDFNVVSREMFLDVFDGKYGKVDRISLGDAIFADNKNKHPSAYLTKGQIEKSALVQARLGHNYDYIEAHSEGSIAENLKNHKHRPGDVETAFLECNCNEYFPKFIDLQNDARGLIEGLYRSPIDLQTEAVGQFICFGGLINSNSNMVSEVEPSNVRSDVAFLAITDDKEKIRLDKKVCTYSLGAYLDKLPKLFIDHEILDFTEIYELDEPAFFQIDCIKGWYFTQRLRKKIAIGDKQKGWFVTADPTYEVKGQPEFLVKSLKPLGRRTIKILISEGFYTPDQIKAAFKNPHANAFQIIDGFNRKGKYYQAVAEYYQAGIYYDRSIPTETQILKDYKLLGRIV